MEFGMLLTGRGSINLNNAFPSCILRMGMPPQRGSWACIKSIQKGGPGVKSISVFWALLVGIFSIAAQVLMYFLRFGRLNTESPLIDYMFFFLAGSLGGAILIFFLNRQISTKGRWVVLIAFLLLSPIALFSMLIGGLFGPFGPLILPQIPWALFTWIGSLLGRAWSQAKT